METPDPMSGAAVATPDPAVTVAAKPATTKRATTRKGAAKPATKAKRARRKPDPIKAWVKRLERTRPGLVPFVLDGLVALYGQPVFEPVHDPTTELVLTILSQNSADINAEKAFESLRRAYPS